MIHCSVTVANETFDRSIRLAERIEVSWHITVTAEICDNGTKIKRRKSVAINNRARVGRSDLELTGDDMLHWPPG